MHRSNKEWLDTFCAEMLTVPNPDIESFKRGKLLKYSPAFVQTNKSRINRYLKFIGPTPVQRMTAQDVARYCDWTFEQDFKKWYLLQIVQALKKFLTWLYNNRQTDQDLSAAIPYVSTSGATSRYRKIPKLSDEEWGAIRAAGKTLQEKLVMALLFNGLRTFEVAALRWESMERGYFDQFDGSWMTNVLRKGGERHNVTVDPETWALLKEKWVSEGRPKEGRVAVRGGSVRDTRRIKEIFTKCKERVLYKPEDHEVRKQLTPHCVRHYYAQKFAVDNPEFALRYGDVAGGWTPGSTVYKNRYCAPRDNFPKVFHAIYKEAAK